PPRPAAPIETQPGGGEAAGGGGEPAPGPARPGPAPHASPPADSVMRHDYKPWKVQRPEPSCKPKSEYQPSDTPFEKETQYQKDFRAWPIPKRGDHPWIPKPGPSPVLALDRGTFRHMGLDGTLRTSKSNYLVCYLVFTVVKITSAPVTQAELPGGPCPSRAEDPRAGRRAPGGSPQSGAEGQNPLPRPAAHAAGDAAQETLGFLGWISFPHYHYSPVGLIPEPLSFLIFRNEFRPWVDVKPVKAIKAKAQYKPPEEKMTHETSYSAQFKGETSKPAPADNKYLERRRIRTLYSEPYKEPPKV
ncbi:Microtubule-associated protein 6, partial [Nipponia nippon]